MDQIRNYFIAEKYESLLFVFTGIIAIGCGVYFLSIVKKPFTTGMAFPLIIVALIQLTVGFTVYFRSPKDLHRIEQLAQKDVTQLKTSEITRMEVVMRNFLIYRYIEIVLMIMGLILMFAFDNNDLLKGIGIGLFMQATLMLTLDFFAERRGADYLQHIKSMI